MSFFNAAAGAGAGVQAVATLWASVIAGAAALAATVLGAVNASRTRWWIRRAQWWERFSWACEKAVSKAPGEAELGLAILSALIDAQWTATEDNEMALGVTNAITLATIPDASETRER